MRRRRARRLTEPSTPLPSAPRLRRRCADIPSDRKRETIAADVIEIIDLNRPILTPVQQQTLDHCAAHPVVFCEEAILSAARAATGLDDFGADDFRERLAVWIEAIDADEGLSPLNRMSLRGMCVRYASTRLRIEDTIRRHPEILSIEIDRPIIVAGLPRSGTTNLVSLLSADARLRSLLWCWGGRLL